MVHITSMVMEKMQFNHFLLPWQPNQEIDWQTFSFFNCPYPFNICTKLESYCFSGFRGVVIKRYLFFLILMLPWQLNKIVTGHKTHKLGRQSSNDHNCQIWFTSLQWLWRKCNLTIFSYKSIEVLSFHGNQTKRQTGRLLAIFNCPYPSNICTKLESCCFSGFGGVVF